jgi:hypothetical protein
MFPFAANVRIDESAILYPTGDMFMGISCRRPVFIRVLRSGLPLLAGAALCAGQETPPAAPGGIAPNPDQGSVDASGKFVPATPPAEAPKTPASADEWRDSAATLIEKTGEHTFRIGMVHGDRKARTLLIPAQVNAREGLIEYALVTRQGKIHESLLVTDADPLHVQMAALLLGISPPAGKPQPHEVRIEVEWATNGPMRKVPLEDCIALAKDMPGNTTGGTMTRGPWNFTGSQIDSGGFVAAREGSLVSLIEDPAAVIVNPRPGREDDSLHVPNAAALPADGVPVTIRVVLIPPASSSGESPAKP